MDDEGRRVGEEGRRGEEEGLEARNSDCKDEESRHMCVNDG